jgi:FMN-dependent NADH-azoreductase
MFQPRQYNCETWFGAATLDIRSFYFGARDLRLALTAAAPECRRLHAGGWRPYASSGGLMSRLLHIECSPRKTRSASIEIARAFLAEYREHHPQDAIEVLDLWSTPLPEFDGDALEGKYAGLAGLARSPAQDLAWTRIRELAAMLHAADKLVISMPMWNFGVPYKFKHFVDLISHKDVLFSFTPEAGLQGLLGGRKALAIYARGVDYSETSRTPAAEWDLQKPYVDIWLKLIGITDVTSIIVERTIYGVEVDRESRAQGAAEARALAKTF